MRRTNEMYTSQWNQTNTCKLTLIELSVGAYKCYLLVQRCYFLYVLNINPNGFLLVFNCYIVVFWFVLDLRCCFLEFCREEMCLNTIFLDLSLRMIIHHPFWSEDNYLKWVNILEVDFADPLLKESKMKFTFSRSVRCWNSKLRTTPCEYKANACVGAMYQFTVYTLHAIYYIRCSFGLKYLQYIKIGLVNFYWREMGFSLKWFIKK